MDSSPDVARRNILQYAYLTAIILLVFLLPLGAHYFLAPIPAGWTILIALALLAFLGGMLDAYLFRFTWSFSLIFGAAFWLSAALFYPHGSWIYGVIYVLLALVGGKVCDRSSASE
ncbi:hypothetical protein GP475_11780 [Corynebacterium poyangense]|uniref:Uncharacterized protein n=1 Tax=Corynebacterium poyangense TaxID=2684405 RepID=A0A7H0SRR1_9CORY|nr:hypothetical protein [Corynebacterium poyangense]MBZ8176670.1 hypothetical protein [Corynebacterium poyangense]QNQ91236.1 hypothetical protein GP475_11780 [Corynebacterium poyangense]